MTHAHIHMYENEIIGFEQAGFWPEFSTMDHILLCILSFNIIDAKRAGYAELLLITVKHFI